MNTFTTVVDAVSRVIDGAGVAVTVLGAAASAVIAVRTLVRHQPGAYTQFRRQLGRSILLGLELLVAADIIRTVAVSTTLQSVAVLGVVVLIRTFLSFSLELEITGRWPWQTQRDPSGGAAAADASSPGPTGS